MTHTTIDLEPTTTTPPRPARTRRPGKLVLSGLTGLVGFVLALAGLALVATHLFARDGDGYYTADAELHSGGYALTTEDVNLSGPVPVNLLGTIRVRAEADGGDPLFVGIAKSSDVARYLSGVSASEVDDFGDDGKATYTQLPGHAPRGRPAEQDFWVAQSQGAGQRTLDWDIDSGDWTVVAMNPDASSGLSLDADVGAKATWLVWAGLGLTVVGFGVIGAAVALARRPGASRGH